MQIRYGNLICFITIERVWTLTIFFLFFFAILFIHLSLVSSTFYKKYCHFILLHVLFIILTCDHIRYSCTRSSVCIVNQIS